jgi:hypothetical protein
MKIALIAVHAKQSVALMQLLVMVLTAKKQRLP